MTQRDYRKFLRADGRLDVRLVPRAVYVEMVNRHKMHEPAIEAVFEQLRWMWDLNKRAKAAAAERRTVTRAELAAEIMAEMDDRDWWAITAAFEDHLAETFAGDVDRWRDLLDPVYDWQESEGWRDRHYAPYPLAGVQSGGGGSARS